MFRAITTAATTAVLAALTMTVAGAQTGPAPYNPPGFERGQYGSNANLYQVEQRLERSIDQLSHDQHDYDGHRVRALEEMQAAVHDIRDAERFARQNGY